MDTDASKSHKNCRWKTRFSVPDNKIHKNDMVKYAITNDGSSVVHVYVSDNYFVSISTTTDLFNDMQ